MHSIDMEICIPTCPPLSVYFFVCPCVYESPLHHLSPCPDPLSVYLSVFPVVLQARYRKEQAVAQQVPWIPPVDNLLKDTTDGCAVATLLHFYCPQLVRLEGTLTRQY